MTNIVTSPAEIGTVEKLTTALDACLELIFEGRNDDLQDDEQEAVEMAEAALAQARNENAKRKVVVDPGSMGRADKYDLAAKIISDISSEWDAADDTVAWQEKNVAEYESSMSFDELAYEVRAVTFKK